MTYAEMTVRAVYDVRLVVLSYLVAVIATYTALILIEQVGCAQGARLVAWLAGGGIAMGGGIWTMHVLGMLASRLPVPISYDLSLVVISLLLPIFASTAALSIVGRADVRLPALVAAGIGMGVGIIAMHYTGMAAMEMAGHNIYDSLRVGASVGIAIGASLASLGLVVRFRPMVGTGARF